MAPEQIRGEDVDFRGDLFAFGLLIYEMASGANPFEAASSTATIARILEDTPAQLSKASLRVRGAGPDCRDLPREGSSRSLLVDAAVVADLERLEKGGADDRPAARRRQALTAEWWWEFHQIAVATVYVLMLYQPGESDRGWRNRGRRCFCVP